MPQKTILSLLVTLLLAVAVLAQTPPFTQAKVNIIIDRETIRFAPQEAPQELRLVVTDQGGAELYDSGPLAVATLDWPLRDTQSAAVKGGLYLYTLSIKDGVGELSQRRGYLIVNRTGDADGIWLATSDKVGIGAGSESAQLAVVGNREVTLGRAELPGSIPPRAALGERSDLPQRKTDGISNEKNEKAAAPAAPTSTANQVAKFAGDGVSLIDSAISEVSGNVGIGTTAPQSGLDYRNALAPFFTRDIGTTNFGGTQSALQLGVTNLGSRNVNVGPAFLFFADNSVGAKSFLGRVAGAWENPTAGAEAGYLRFQVRANSGDTGASTERMRITANGNVGIGTTNPAQPLEIATGRMRLSSNLGDIEFTETADLIAHATTANPAGNLSAFRVDVGVNLTRAFTVLNNGNVGIGTTTPANVRLKVVADDSGQGVAVWGETNTNNGYGVYGQSNVGSSAAGVFGNSGSGYGVYGAGGYGVFGFGSSPGSYGVYGSAHSGSSGGYSGYFEGNVRITGLLEKAGGNFKIDHPLDPENKYLIHSFVESPDMKNLYDGTVTTDANGEAEVTLPDWFAALNRDFRYQLTVIGVFAQAIIAEKIKDNRFKIKTSLPNVEVSWQVTGTRQDAWANQNRLPVEELKPEVERGSYQNPTAFGQPEEKSIEWVRHPEMMKQQKERRERSQRERAQKEQAPPPNQ